MHGLDPLNTHGQDMSLMSMKVNGFSIILTCRWPCELSGKGAMASHGVYMDIHLLYMYKPLFLSGGSTEYPWHLCHARPLTFMGSVAHSEQILRHY